MHRRAMVFEAQESARNKVLQDTEICVYQAIENVMKTKKALDKLKTIPFKELPTIKKVSNVSRY